MSARDRIQFVAFGLVGVIAYAGVALWMLIL